MRPVGDNGAAAEFPGAIAAFIAIEVAAAHQHIEGSAAPLYAVHGKDIDFAFGALAGDDDIVVGDMVLEDVDWRLNFGQAVNEFNSEAVEERAMILHGVGMVERAHQRLVLAVGGAGIGQDEIANGLFGDQCGEAGVHHGSIGRTLAFRVVSAI